MKCTDVQKMLNEALDPGILEQPEAEAHISSCPDCMHHRTELQELRGQLEQLPPPALPDGFQLALRRRLIRAEQTLRVEGGSNSLSSTLTERPRKNWVVYALAATILLAIGGILTWRTIVTSSTNHKATYFSLNVSVQSNQRYPDARFTIDLPEEVTLPNSIAKQLLHGQTVQWKSELKPGINAVELPLIMHGGPTQVHARLTIGGKTYNSSAVLVPEEKEASLLTQKKQIQTVLAFNLYPRRKKCLAGAAW